MIDTNKRTNPYSNPEFVCNANPKIGQSMVFISGDFFLKKKLNYKYIFV